MARKLANSNRLPSSISNVAESDVIKLASDVTRPIEAVHIDVIELNRTLVVNAPHRRQRLRDRWSWLLSHVCSASQSLALGRHIFLFLYSQFSTDAHLYFVFLLISLSVDSFDVRHCRAHRSNLYFPVSEDAHISLFRPPVLPTAVERSSSLAFLEEKNDAIKQYLEPLPLIIETSHNMTHSLLIHGSKLITAGMSGCRIWYEFTVVRLPLLAERHANADFNDSDSNNSADDHSLQSPLAIGIINQ